MKPPTQFEKDCCLLLHLLMDWRDGNRSASLRNEIKELHQDLYDKALDIISDDIHADDCRWAQDATDPFRAVAHLN